MHKKRLFVGIVFLIFLLGCVSFDMDSNKGKTKQEMAIETKNPNYCAQASFPDTCYLGYAKEIKDGSVCINISDPNTKKSCETLTASNKDCSELEGNEQDSCFADIAVKEQKATICNDITNSINRNDCYARVSEAKGEWEPCEKINNDNKQNLCIQNIALMKGDASICEKMPLYGLGLDYDTTGCAIQVGKKFKDPKVCENLQNESDKKLCIAETK